MNNNYDFQYEESSFGLVPEGQYETILEVSKKITPNTQREYISLKWKIRDDVDQPCQNRNILEAIWDDKENPGRFPTKKLNKILSIQGKDGRYNFGSDIDEVLQFINGWNVRIGVKIGKPDDFHDEEYNFVSFYAATKNPNQTLGSKSSSTPTATTSVEFEVGEDDLPF